MPQKHNKGKGKKQDTSRYYIQTTGGNVIYNGSDEITVQVAPKSFLRKRVSDVNTGERVLFDVGHTKTTLEDVEPHLPRSPMYGRVSNYVFGRNTNGEMISRFRIALLRTLAERNVINNDRNLEARIMNETDDTITGFEYQKGAEYLSELLINSKAPERHSAHIPEVSSIKEWIRGRTLSPRDHSVFRILQRELGDSFNQFISNPEDPNGYYRNYRTYVVIRQQIMKMLNGWRGLTRGAEEDEIERQSKINITREIDLIRSHFLKDVTEDLKSVMVTDIEEVSSRREYDLHRTDRIIGEGIIRGVIRDLARDMTPVSAAIDHLVVLQSYFYSIMFEHPSIEHFTNAIKHHIADHAHVGLMRLYREELDPSLRFVEEVINSPMYVERLRALLPNRLVSEVMSQQEIFLVDIGESIFNYSLDRKIGFEDGTSANCMETYFRSRRTAPKSFFKYTELWRKLSSPMSKLTQQERQRTVNEFKRNCEYLSQNYGIRFNKLGAPIGMGFFFTEFINDSLVGDDVLTRTVIGADRKIGEVPQTEIFRLIRDNEGIRRQFMRKLTRDRYIRTRDYTYKVLEQFGLGYITDIRSDDFEIEEWGTSFRKPPKTYWPK
jgi:hypothetical protein